MNGVRIGIALVFLADVTVKILVRQHPATAGRFAFWTPLGPIGMVPSTNDVLAFSLPIPNVVIWPVGWVVVAALLWELRRISHLKFQIPNRRVTAIGMVVLGALSNLIDRTLLGGVTDYLSFTNLFPAFNVADLLILGGIAGWLRSSQHVVDAA